MTRRSAAAQHPPRWLGAAFAGAIAFAGATGVERVASAQSWLSDPSIAQGPGVKSGDLELHPGVGAEIGYDTNYFLRTSKKNASFVNGGPTTPPTDAGLMRVTPSFFVQSIGANAPADPTKAQSPFAFRGGASLSYRYFVGKQEIQDQRDTSIDASLRLDFNRGRPVGFGVFGGYSRIIQPNAVGNPDFSFDRDYVNGGFEIVAIPGGGTLDLRAQYQAFASLFEESEGVPYSSITHEFAFRDRWKFRPRTALFHDTTLRVTSYPDSGRATNFLADSTPLRTRLGVTGLITDRFGTLLAVGYGATFFSRPELGAATKQFDSIDGQAEFTYYLNQSPGYDSPGGATLLLSTITLGFQRDFQTSLLADYYTSNKGYLKFQYMFGPKAVIQLLGEFEMLQYPQPFINTDAGPVAETNLSGNPTGDFTNYRVGGTLFGEYRVTPSFALNATAQYGQMISKQSLLVGSLPGQPGAGPGGAPLFYDLSWNRFQAFLGARWFL